MSRILLVLVGTVASNLVPFDELFQDSLQREKVATHGCWCAKLGGGGLVSNNLLGGSQPVDDVDTLCKHWLQDRHCVKFEGGPCFENWVPYNVTFDPITSVELSNLDCTPNDPKTCSWSCCMIDRYYAIELSVLMSDPSWATMPVTDSSTCSAQALSPVNERFCAGEFNVAAAIPEFQIVPDRDAAGLSDPNLNLAPGCTSEPRDIIFVVDSTGSVGKNYPKQVTFLRNIMSYMDMGAEKTRAAIVQYSWKQQTEFYFQTTLEDWQSNVDQMQLIGGPTYTGKAIRFAYDDIVPSHARLHLGIDTVMVVVTDGQSFDDVEEVSDEMRSHGIRMYAVGVDEIGDSTVIGQLNEIANTPSEKHAKIVSSFDDLDDLGFNLASSLCT